MDGEWRHSLRILKLSTLRAWQCPQRSYIKACKDRPGTVILKLQIHSPLATVRFLETDIQNISVNITHLLYQYLKVKVSLAHEKHAALDEQTHILSCLLRVHQVLILPTITTKDVPEDKGLVFVNRLACCLPGREKKLMAWNCHCGDCGGHERCGSVVKKAGENDRVVQTQNISCGARLWSILPY